MLATFINLHLLAGKADFITTLVINLAKGLAREEIQLNIQQNHESSEKVILIRGLVVGQ